MKGQELLELLDTLDMGECNRLVHYGGEVIAHFHEKLHIYFTEAEDGTRFLVPGATTVTGMVHKPALVWWSAGKAVEYVMQNIHPDPEVQAQMLCFYQRLRDKAPWDDAVLGDPMIIAVQTDELVKLLNAARGAHNQIKEDASNVGHMAHEWIEFYLHGLMAGRHYYATLPEEPRARNCVLAALDWMERHKFKPVQSENKVFSRQYQYCGTEDWEAYVTSCGDPKCCPFEGTHYELGDWKSSNNLYDEYRFQTAAYKYAREEEFPDLHIDGRRLLRLGKEDGAFESMYCPNEDFEADMDAFIGCLMMYNRLRHLELEVRYDKQVAKAKKDAEKALLKKAKPPRKTKVKQAVVKDYEPIPVGDSAGLESGGLIPVGV
jgi:hypothetical protein